jgi:hypothetical protein
MSLPPSHGSGGHSDSRDTVIIVIEGPGDTTRRLRRRDIRGIPPGAFDLPPAPEKRPKDKTEDGGMKPTSNSPGVMPSSQSDSLDSAIVVIDGPGDTTRRPMRRDIRGIPPGAFDLPPEDEKRKKKPKKKPEDGPKDDG